MSSGENLAFRKGRNWGKEKMPHFRSVRMSEDPPALHSPVDVWALLALLYAAHTFHVKAF